MNRERALLLAEALEAGKYIQGYNVLEINNPGEVKHCCLGVACRVVMEHGVELELNQEGGGNTFFNGHDVGLPPVVQDWFGFYESDGRFRDESEIDGAFSLAEINDSMNFSFVRIAEIIRENWERL